MSLELSQHEKQVTDLDSEIPRSEKYFLLQDSRALVQRLVEAKGVTLNESQLRLLNNLADSYFERINQVLRGSFGHVSAFSEEFIDRQLRRVLEKEFDEKSDRRAIVCLDRYLLRGKNNFPIHRFSINRRSNGQLSPRALDPSFHEQLKLLAYDVGAREVILVDDGMVNGGTIKFVAKHLLSKGIKVAKVVLFLGPINIDTITIDDGEGGNIPLVKCQDFNGVDWINGRDFSPLGGIPRAELVESCIKSAAPYIAPFSQGQRASLKGRPDFLRLSLKIHEASMELFQSVKMIIGDIVVWDVIRAGLPLMCDEEPGGFNGGSVMPFSSPIIDILERHIGRAEDCMYGYSNQPPLPMVGCL